MNKSHLIVTQMPVIKLNVSYNMPKILNIGMKWGCKQLISVQGRQERMESQYPDVLYICIKLSKHYLNKKVCNINQNTNWNILHKHVQNKYDGSCNNTGRKLWKYCL